MKQIILLLFITKLYLDYHIYYYQANEKVKKTDF